MLARLPRCNVVEGLFESLKTVGTYNLRTCGCDVLEDTVDTTFGGFKGGVREGTRPMAVAIFTFKFSFHVVIGTEKKREREREKQSFVQSRGRVNSMCPGSDRLAQRRQFGNGHPLVEALGQHALECASCCTVRGCG